MTIYWVPRDGAGRLGLMPRPRGGDWIREEMASLKSQNVHILVSALTDWEVQELDLGGQAAACKENQIELWRYPIYDRTTPALDATIEILRRISAALREQKSIVVHCRLGIGRSGILTAGTLILEGERAAVAINRVSRARELTIPDTDEQAKWLYVLGRKVVEDRIKSS